MFSKIRVSFLPLCIALGFFGAILAIYLALYRGLWLDEFFSLAMSDPRQSFAALAQLWWINDSHPPLYMALLRIFSEVMPHTVIALRLTNTLWAALLAAYLWVQYRRHVLSETQIGLAILLVFASPLYLSFFGELRSYFFNFVFLTIHAFSLVIICRFWLLNQVPSRGDLACWFISLLAVTNIHFFAVVMVGSLTLVFVIMLVCNGKRRAAVFLASGGVLAVLPFCATTAWQYAALVSSANVGWITTSPSKAVMISLKMAIRAVAYNWPLLVVAATAVFLRQRDEQETFERKTAFMLLYGVILFLVFMLAVNAVKPVIMGRYMIPMAPPLLVAVILLASRQIVGKGLSVLILLFGLYALVSGFLKSFESSDRWRTSTRSVATQYHDCTDTRVFVRPIGTNANAMIVMALGYEVLARQFGFPITVLGRGDVLPSARECPTILWLEEITYPRDLLDGTPSDILKRLDIAPPQGDIELQRHGTGALIVVKPLF